MKQLVGKVEVAATGDFVPRNQDGIEFRKTAGSPRDAALRIDHEDQDGEFPLQDFAQAGGGDIAKAEFGGEPFTGQHGILEAGPPAEPKRPAHERHTASHPWCQIPESGDPASGSAFVGRKPLTLDAGMPPAESAFADQQEGIDKVLQGSVERLDREHQLFRRHSPDARLYGRYGLPILETEQAGKTVLRELALFA